MSDEAKHTPGPWSAREHYADITIGAAGFREPALVRRIIGRSDECQTALRAEQVANARLIAAAPEMAEILAVFVSQFPPEPPDEECEGEMQFRCMHCRARGALAKAGVQP